MWLRSLEAWKGVNSTQVTQVCYTAEEPLPPREIAGLKEAMATTGIDDGLLLTRDVDRVLEDVPGRRIRALPLWRWLCEWAPQ